MAKHTAELKSLSDTDLVQRLAESREELFNLRFQNATGQLDSSSRIGQVKKDIARLNTILRQREIALAEENSNA